MSEPQRPPLTETSEVWKGIGLAMVMHLIWVPLALVPGLAVGVAGIGVVQLLYQVPAVIIYSRKGRKAMMKGLIMGGDHLPAECGLLWNRLRLVHVGPVTPL